MGQRWQKIAPLAISLACVFHVGTSLATPPEYTSFNREQRTNVDVDADEVLRIWCVYVGQGDGILLQLPNALAYDPDGEGPVGREERVDILVDAGSFEPQFAGEMAAFVRRLYPDDPSRIEHGVLTHHDKDHVEGFSAVLEDPAIVVEHLYHNGLASFVAGARGLPKTGKPSRPGVFELGNNRITRALGLLRSTGNAFLAEYIIDDLQELQRSVGRAEFQGVYERFARSIVDAPNPVLGFHRASTERPFIADIEQANRAGLGDVRFEVLWPEKDLLKYGDWGKTINGNSVTFRLVYRDFEMLFTGDHNELSEPAIVQALQDRGELVRLRADVLKVPHHGSGHGSEGFFRAVSPVLSVASQGPKGAESKAMGNSRAWQHPSTEVIGWLGGAHRVYLTHLEERRFDWAEIDTKAKLADMVEPSHVLIETDGRWFRIVEVPLDWQTLDEPPTIQATVRSDGTRWIRARE